MECEALQDIVRGVKEKLACIARNLDIDVKEASESSDEENTCDLAQAIQTGARCAHSLRVLHQGLLAFWCHY